MVVLAHPADVARGFGGFYKAVSQRLYVVLDGLPVREDPCIPEGRAILYNKTQDTVTIVDLGERHDEPGK